MNERERLGVRGIYHSIMQVSIIALALLVSGCGASQRLSPDKAREKIQGLGLLELKGKEVQIEKIDQSREDQAIAEANLKLAFKLSRGRGRDWQIDAVRLGDRNWLEMRAFWSALNEVRARETLENMQKLLDGLKRFKAKTGKYPEAENIVKLTDALVPSYMVDVIRYDSWNRELIFRATSPDSFQILSLGSDGISGTADDIVVSP